MVVFVGYVIVMMVELWWILMWMGLVLGVGGVGGVGIGSVMNLMGLGLMVVVLVGG